MKSLIVVILILLFSVSSFGQVKTYEIPMSKIGDTSLWYKWEQEDFRKSGLPDLKLSKDSLHFRFANEIQSVEIWTNDFKTFNGTFMNHTTSVPCDNCLIKGKSKFYSKKYSLDAATAKGVYELFSQLSVFNIPTQDSIKGWSSGFDGEEFFIEYSTPSHYSFKEYWTPNAFKEIIKEAAAIDTLAIQLKTKLEMDLSFSTFIKNLPFGCYHYISYIVTCQETRPDFIMW